ncbi:MAG: hypothetical protein J7J91_04410 [Deltaproteobacteria bacterium]|nr:hypothetical protein [Deltaproteobacteria bacterium]
MKVGKEELLRELHLRESALKEAIEELKAEFRDREENYSLQLADLLSRCEYLERKIQGIEKKLRVLEQRDIANEEKIRVALEDRVRFSSFLDFKMKKLDEE